MGAILRNAQRELDAPIEAAVRRACAEQRTVLTREHAAELARIERQRREDRKLLDALERASGYENLHEAVIERIGLVVRAYLRGENLEAPLRAAHRQVQDMERRLREALDALHAPPPSAGEGTPS